MMMRFFPPVVVLALVATFLPALAFAFDATRLQPSEIAVDPAANNIKFSDIEFTEADYNRMLQNMPAALKAQGGVVQITRNYNWAAAWNKNKGYYNCTAANVPLENIPGYRSVSASATLVTTTNYECNMGIYGNECGVVMRNTCTGERTYRWGTL